MTPALSAHAGSLRWRLLAITAALATLVVALTATLLLGLARDAVQRQFASALRSQLDEVTARLEWTPNGAPTLAPEALSDPRWRRPYGGLYWQVQAVDPSRLNGPGGAPPLRSRSLWDAQLAPPPDAVADGEVHVHNIAGPDGQALLLLERSVRPAGDAAPAWRVLVAGDLAETEAAVQPLRRALVGGAVLLLALLLGAAWLQTGVGLAPLRRLQAALGALRTGRAQRIEGQFPQELQPLVDDFNRVLAQQADSLARARTQAGNLAHALKTPLAVLGQAAEHALGEDPGRPSQPALAALVNEQVQRVRRQVDWHLARARVAAAQGQAGLRAPVRVTAEGLLRVMARVHAARELQLAFDATDPLPDFAGDGQDLHEMLGNLLDNACQWAAGRVRLRATADDTGLLLCVDDDGPGIPPDQRAQALTRGQRLDESVPGSGLGLAIVAELAALYGGALTLDRADWGGLQARLRLPACADPNA